MMIKQQQQQQQPNNSNTKKRGFISTLQYALFFVFGTMIWTTVRQDTTRFLREQSSSSSSSSSIHRRTTKSCGHRMEPCQPAVIIINKAAVRSFSKQRLNEIKHLTFVNYEKFMLAPPGQEHYTFMEYMVQIHGGNDGGHDEGRFVVDIGTRYVASALAMGAHGTTVHTFDIPNSRERQQAFRGRSESEWQTAVQAMGIDIKFHNLDLMKVSNQELQDYMGTWLISLDTFHLPYSVPFEREFFERLIDIGFKGILSLDDIHLNAEMKKWWNEILQNAPRYGYRCFDVSDIGHVTGTGLVDFSGKVQIVDDDSLLLEAAK